MGVGVGVPRRRRYHAREYHHSIPLGAMHRSIEFVNSLILSYNTLEQQFLQRLVSVFHFTGLQMNYARKWCRGATAIMVGSFLWSLETERYKSTTHLFRELVLQPPHQDRHGDEEEEDDEEEDENDGEYEMNGEETPYSPAMWEEERRWFRRVSI